MAAPPLQPVTVHRRSTSLYVGDLDPGVTETDLYAAFFQMGPISSVRICHCATTRNSLCYGYVNFYTHDQACKALSVLNHSYLRGKPMRLMWSQRDPSGRKSGIGNLYVKNLDTSIDSARLETLFCKFGTILSCKVVEENGKSKGYGFVQFDSEDSALAARIALHDSMVEGKKLYVSKFVKKCERTMATPCEESFTNLYIKNLAEDITEDTLNNMFSAFGEVCNVVIMRDHNRRSRGFGFVNFKSPEDARKAVDALNGYPLGSRNLFVEKAQNKAERNILQEYKGITYNNIEKFKTSNLFVNNLDVSISTRKLYELFSPCGQIVSARVMQHDNGLSKGFGFVSFSSPAEANRALNSLNGIMVEGKHLHVAIAKCKRDHYVEQQAQMLYLPNCNVFPPSVSPLYFSSYCPSLTFPQYPISYQQFGVNMGVHYPTAKHQQFFYSYIPTVGVPQTAQNPTAQPCEPHPMKQTTYHLRDRDLNTRNAGKQNVGTKKKWTKKVGATGSTSRVLQAAAAKSHDNSKKDNANLLSPLAENLQPEHAGMLLEMSNPGVVNLLHSPNHLVQVLKEVNALKRADDNVVLQKSNYSW